MKNFVEIFLVVFVAFLNYSTLSLCDSKISNLAELRKSILEHEKEIDNLHGITSSFVDETGDVLRFSKRRSIFTELNKTPIPGIPTTTIKMTLKFPNTAPVVVNQGKLREEIKNTANGNNSSTPNINPIPLVVIRPDALTNLLASLSATVYQRKKIEGKYYF